MKITRGMAIASREFLTEQLPAGQDMMESMIMGYIEDHLVDESSQLSAVVVYKSILNIAQHIPEKKYFLLGTEKVKAYLNGGDVINAEGDMVEFDGGNAADIVDVTIGWNEYEEITEDEFLAYKHSEHIRKLGDLVENGGFRVFWSDGTHDGFTSMRAFIDELHRKSRLGIKEVDKNRDATWEFIEKYHQDYAHSDKVFHCDILKRYLNNEEVDIEDVQRIVDVYSKVIILDDAMLKELSKSKLSELKLQLAEEAISDFKNKKS